MAQYDGSIRINTQINTKQAQVNLSTLENRIVKTSDKIASLRSKMDSLKDAKIPTERYKTLSKELEKLVQKQNSYNEQLKEFEGVSNKENLPLYRELKEKLEDSYETADKLIAKMRELSESGKAFTLGRDTEEFAKLGQQLQYAESDLEVLNKKHDILQLKQEKAADGYKRLGSVAKQSFNSVGKTLTKANSYVNSFGKKLKEIAHKILPTFHKETKRTNTALGQFSTRLKSLLSGIFIFNVISSNIRKMFSGIDEGFENFYNQNAAFKSSVDSMRTSLLQLKNTFAAAFAPIVSVAIPYLEKLISYITKAVNSIGQLIAALLGKKTYTKAIRVNVENLEDTSDALEEVKESAKDAEKALDGYLSPLDEINKYSEDKEAKVDIDTGKKPDVSDIGDTVQDMFEEVPIGSYFLGLADKIKDVFSQLFAPLKEAWNREGKFVMDSWETALKEVGALAKSMGSDFLEVWQQEKTVKIFEDLLHIIGDIGLVVGNLAHNFRLAWEENETGKRILEGIRDIIGVIVSNIRHAADATAEWSKDLDFSPLLTKIQVLIESLVPVFDNLSGVITDFYEKVLLPLGKWVLEKGLPDLLQVFIGFNNKVDWEALRSRLAQFWEHLEPFAETVGEGLILFIERCANALADFINSPAFDNFLTMIENWMDSVKPEDVADALEAIAKSIIALKGGIALWGALETPIKLFGSFISMVSGAQMAKALKYLSGGSSAAKGMEDMGKAAAGTSSAFGGLSTAATLAGGAIAGLALAEPVKDKIDELRISAGENGAQVKSLSEEYNGFSGTLRLVRDSVGGLFMAMQGLPNVATTSAQGFAALEKALNKTSDGYIYSDKQMSKMQKTWQLSNEDMESLRQSMLDANPELRELADGFGLFDASVETLQDIQQGMKLISDGTITASQAFDEFSKPMWGMNENAKIFFQNLSDGKIELDEYSSKLSYASETMNKFGTDAETAGINIANGLTTGLQSVDILTPVKNICDSTMSMFKEKWGIHSPSTVMIEMGKNLIQGLLNGISSLSVNIKAVWEETKQAAAQTWEEIERNLSEKWNNLKTGAKETFGNIKNEIKESWSNIKTNVKESAENVQTNIVNAWSKAKEATASAWGNIKEKAVSSVQSMAGSIREKFGNTSELIRSFSSTAQNIWSDAWEGMKNKVSSILSSIQSTISSVFGWIHNMITSLGNALRSLASSIFSFGSTSTAKTVRTFSQSSRMASPMYQPTIFDTLRTTPIPALARGAVIPANREFLAVLGDQKHGTNVEAPLETIKQANREAFLEVMSKLGVTGTNRASSPQTFTVQVVLDKKVLGQTMVDWGKLQQMITGNNPYGLGTT